MIQTQTGSATYISVNEGTLPAFTEVHSSTPAARRPQPLANTQPILSRQSTPPPQSQPAKPATTVARPAKAAPQVHQQEFRATAAQIALLSRKQGGFFASIFGGGKSPLEKIQTATGVQIKVNTSTNVIKVVGQTPQAINQAVTAIKQALR